jgi:hypothetical protein
MWNAPAYRDSFLSLVDSLRFDQLYPPGASRKTVRIHVDKTGHGLASALKLRELASFIAGQEWDAWFDLEEHTANLLMAYLATILGQSQPSRMDPITDSGDCVRAFTTVPTRDGKVEARLDTVRTEVLADLLPAPIDYISPGALAEFKGEHKHLLTNFRVEVETRVVAASAIENSELRARSVGLIKTDLKGQLDEITRRMQEHKWQRIGLGTLQAVISGGLLVADATVGGGALSIAGNSLGLTSAVYAAFDGARTPKDLLSHPMAYGALAHRQLGGRA